MSKSQEDSPIIIPKNEYREDLEAEVQYHTSRILATNPFRVNKKFVPIEIPVFDPRDKRSKLDWELDQIEKCRTGTNDMPGRYYFFHNFVNIKHKSRGKIRPDFRATALHTAKVIDKVIKTTGRGLICVKRRQIGMSWYIAADNIYDCIFNRDFDIGMNSKGLIDSQNLFIKHKYIHRNLPDFLRTYINSDRRDAMIFSGWDKKKQIWKGTGSSIISVAPTPTGHAGNQYKKLVCDELGETEDALAIFSNAEDCIMQDGVRVGTFIGFGTMGETNKAGKGLMEFWTKSDQYNFEQLGLWGYSALLLDDRGNDMIEDGVRWILYERKKKESLSSVIYNKFIQRYPLHEDDAFLSISGAGVGSPVLLSKQYKRLMENPPLVHKGRMSPGADGKPQFIADEANGKIIIYERPELIANGYIACNDPAEDDGLEKNRDNSNISTAIIAKPFGLNPPRLVAEYVDRPPLLATYYEQLALLLQWYNNTQLNVELNKGGWRLKDYFEQRWPKLLALSPKSFNSIKGGVELRTGVKMTPERKSQMLGLGDAYVENYSEMIPSIRLIEEFKVFGAEHATDDLATAFLWCLIVLQSDRRVATNVETEAAKNPNLRYETVHGVKQLVSRGNVVSPPTIKTKNPLFNKPR